MRLSLVRNRKKRTMPAKTIGENTMKKITAAVLAAVMSLSLAACSGVKDSGATGLENVSSDTALSAVTEQQAAPETASETASHETDEEEAALATVTAEGTEQAPEPTAEAAQTGADYIALIQKYDNLWLGLPSDSKVYVFSDKNETAEIDGQTFHGLSCYDEHEGVLYFMCDFYISEDGETVYRDENSKNALEGVPPEFVLLPEETGFPPLDPKTQTADEVFANACQLTMLFKLGSISVAHDEEDVIDRDGWQYDRVTDERFDTKEKLFGALDKYFSFELVNSWMEAGVVAENDGKIYIRHNDGTGSDPFYDHSEYELTMLEDARALYTEYMYYIYEGNEEEVKEITYTAELENGVWRFTDFTITAP